MGPTTGRSRPRRRAPYRPAIVVVERGGPPRRNLPFSCIAGLRRRCIQPIAPGHRQGTARLRSSADPLRAWRRNLALDQPDRGLPRTVRLPDNRGVPGSSPGLAKELQVRILGGDDFTQWSLRFGRIVLDNGVLLGAVRLIAERQRWPDVERKREHAAKSLALARRVVKSGDQDGALVQVRTGLALSVRAYLLSIGEFPMSRAELPGQLVAAGRSAAAQALEACIHEDPALKMLGDAVVEAEHLLEPSIPVPDSA